MVTQLSFKAPCVELKMFNNLWFQLSDVNCNLKCKHCYLGCQPTTKIKSFLGMEKIKNSLADIEGNKLDYIYLTGGEPLLHPDINSIIRLCLKKANVTILSNGILINDKKARFLRQIEQEHNNEHELVFKISLDHYNEQKNDDIRGKGSFKKAVAAIQHLINYGFNPIINCVNLWNEDVEELKEGFLSILNKCGLEPAEFNVNIIPALKVGEYAKNNEGYKDEEFVTEKTLADQSTCRFDCAYSRVVTAKGVYSCPALVNDPRGKVGNTLKDSATKTFLETSACFTCNLHNKPMFNNEWALK
ncbi:MAG: radical SAM protein [bacterium]